MEHTGATEDLVFRVMSREIRFGILGLSEDNGHPYSWSAIINGYNLDKASLCPFENIVGYLSEHRFPAEAIQGAMVTCVWTQNRRMSEDIATFAGINDVVDSFTNMVGKVDAVLLARDDAETHYDFSAPFIKAGLPIYIDKPIATSVKQAERIFLLEQYTNQVFTCSALSFSEEFDVSDDQLSQLGEIQFVEAVIKGKWETYGVHIVEPVLEIIGYDRDIVSTEVNGENDVRIVKVRWQSGPETIFKTDQSFQGRPFVFMKGTKGEMKLVYRDTFSAFKNALEFFLDVVRGKQSCRPKSFVLKVIEVIEAGIIK